MQEIKKSKICEDIRIIPFRFTVENIIDYFKKNNHKMYMLIAICTSNFIKM